MNTTPKDEHHANIMPAAAQRLTLHLGGVLVLWFFYYIVHFLVSGRNHA